MESVEARAVAHAEVEAALAALDDSRLRSLVLARPETNPGWGTSHVVEIAGRAVFVKRLTLTDVEVDAGPTTRNLFELPVFYSYGVGSAGTGAYREVAAHQIASQLVLQGVTSGFPILHHHRSMARTEPPRPFFEPLAAYLERWGGHEAVGSYIEARLSATHELWTFAEFVPHTAGAWLRANQARSGELLRSLRNAASALNEAGGVHFDAHYANSLTDGTTFLLADFGLTLCSSFELDEEERAFLATHRHYDHALLVCSIGMTVAQMVFGLDEATRNRISEAVGVGPGGSRGSQSKRLTALELAGAVCEHASALREAGLLNLDPALVDLARRYWPPIAAMGEFLDAISRPDKTARFDDARLARLLAAADGLPSAR
jgi:hypothetical protein